jgi:hypothetical protein
MVAVVRRGTENSAWHPQVRITASRREPGGDEIMIRRAMTPTSAAEMTQHGGRRPYTGPGKRVNSEKVLELLASLRWRRSFGVDMGHVGMPLGDGFGRKDR